MIAEFTIIGMVVRSTELTAKEKKMFRFNVAVNTPNAGNSHRSQYINNITVWNPNAIELAKRIILPGAIVYVKGQIQSISASRKKGLRKDDIYFNAHSFFVLRRPEKDIEEQKYKREMSDFVSAENDYLLFPGDSEKNDGYYPTYCGNETDDEGGYNIPEETEE